MVSGNAFNDAAAYEAYMGRWSRPVGIRFIEWLRVAPGGVWLDVGAGTGILTRVILSEAAPQKVVAVDLSAEYLEHARRALAAEPVEFRVGNASELDFGTLAFDAAIAGLVLNFVPSPLEAVQGMRAAVRPGGVVAAYVWDYTDRMQMMRYFWEAAVALDPSARAYASGPQYAVCHPDRLQELFASVGLRDVEVTGIEVPARFTSFDDFWLPFLGAQGSVSKYLRSLSGEQRDAMQAYLREALPIQRDQSIDLVARAWAVKSFR